MNILFLVVLPLATILISIVLHKLLKSPILVAILIFAVYLVLAFTIFTSDFLIAAIIYTIIAFVTAIIFNLICCLIRRLDCNDNNAICMNCNNEENIAELQNSIIGLERSIDLLENNISNLTNILTNISNNNCGCNRVYRR